MEAQRKRKRAGAVVAIAAGAALLVGGSTFALWSATDSPSGGTITAGDLNLVAGTVAPYDVSTDRTDSSTVSSGGNALTFKDATEAAAAEARADATFKLQGHAISDLSTWRIVPGDTVAVVIPYTVTLIGDNMVAALTLDTTNLVDTTNKANDGTTYYYALFDAAGAQIGTTQPVGTVANTALLVGYFQANGTGQAGGVDDTIGATTVPVVATNGTAVVTLALFGYFDANTTDRDYVGLADVLGSVPTTLTQVRSITDQFGPI